MRTAILAKTNYCRIGKHRMTLCRNRNFVACVGAWNGQHRDAHEQRPQPELEPAAAWLSRLSGVGLVGHADILTSGAEHKATGLLRTHLANAAATFVEFHAAPILQPCSAIQRGQATLP